MSFYSVLLFYCLKQFIGAKIGSRGRRSVPSEQTPSLEGTPPPPPRDGCVVITGNGTGHRLRRQAAATLTAYYDGIYILHLLYCTDVVDISFTFWPLDFSGGFFLVLFWLSPAPADGIRRNTTPLGTVDRQCGMRLHTGRRQQEQEEEEAESF